MEIEAIASPGGGRVNITGIVEEEDIADVARPHHAQGAPWRGRRRKTR